MLRIEVDLQRELDAEQPEDRHTVVGRAAGASRSRATSRSRRRSRAAARPTCATTCRRTRRAGRCRPPMATEMRSTVRPLVLQPPQVAGQVRPHQDEARRPQPLERHDVVAGATREPGGVKVGASVVDIVDTLPTVHAVVTAGGGSCSVTRSLPRAPAGRAPWRGATRYSGLALRSFCGSASAAASWAASLTDAPLGEGRRHAGGEDRACCPC